ncbi:hypothetical protein NA57DRAFT_15911, partial [Rhizodiscina lignyota]
KPLGRPIGFERPPRTFENDPVDHRSWRARRDDFHNYDKHLEKRKVMFKRMSKGYYKDWANLKYNQGKTFLANPRVFKKSLSLYFPNLIGRTIASAENKDTTSVLRNKVSVVCMFTSAWAENQIKTFIGQEENPKLREAIASSGGRAQIVRINVEDNFMKWWMIWATMANLRLTVSREEHDKYFILNRDLPLTVRETLGLSNKNVGFVFLVDEDCQIRWAGCGEANATEREYLVKGLHRLLD